jgi:hypothetical protein
MDNLMPNLNLKPDPRTEASFCHWLETGKFFRDKRESGRGVPVAGKRVSKT